ncbi:MAG: SHOCT domain-containing protein [Halalkalicoccus sp.]
MVADTPTERLRENAVSVASMLVVAAGLLSLFTGIGPFWLVFLLGFLIVVPLVALLFGNETERAEWWDGVWGETDWEEWGEWWGESRESDESSTHPEPRTRAPKTESNRDALQTLRYRYAQGDLTDEQFERKLERLLETDTLENADDRRRARERIPEYER